MKNQKLQLIDIRNEMQNIFDFKDERHADLIEKLDKFLDKMEYSSSFEICGFWFHVTWNGINGVDTQGNKWINNPGGPTPENPSLIDNLMDAYNNIISTVNSK